MSWMADADRVGKGFYLIGEDEDGLLCAPTWKRFPDGQRIWKPCIRVPITRLFSSWLQRKIMWIEKVTI